jgi:hypothetical protein
VAIGLLLTGLEGNNNESSVLSPIEYKKIFYIPSTISFKDYYGDQYIRNSVQSILNNATQSVNAYGYAVIVIQPQDFMKLMVMAISSTN